MPSSNDYYGHDIEALVNEYGPQFGIKPAAGMKVFANEGLQNYQSNLIEPKTGKREPSFGAFQLYMGGGLGNEFQKATGLDPRDPSTTPQQVKFAMEQASKVGWGPWKGAARAGMSQWEGITPQSASAITFKELPDAPAGGGLTFKELPEETDAKGRIAQAHDSAVMAGGQRATPEDLAARMQVFADARGNPSSGLPGAAGRAVDLANTLTRGEAATGPIGAAVRGAKSGATFGFQDELKGAGAYLGNLLSGTDAASRAYTNTVEAERVARQLDEANSPVARTVGEVGGAVANPIGGSGRLLVKGAGVAPAVGRALEVGGRAGLVGGIQGAGNAEGGLENRLSGAQGGAALGFGIGAGARPLGAAVGFVAKPVTNVVGALGAALRPTASAERRVVGALSRDIANKDAGLAGQQLDDALAAGKPVLTADVGGETTRLLARSAKNTSPEGAAVLQGATTERFAGQAGRLSDSLDNLSTFKGMSPTKIHDTIEAVARDVNTPAYKRALADGDRHIWNDELAALTNAPAFGPAVKQAFQNIANRIVAEGGQPPDKANLLMWDAVKKAIDGKASEAFRLGHKDEGGALAGLAGRLRGILDKEVPSYPGARAGAASFFGADDAYKAGQGFATGSLKNDAIGKAQRDFNRLSEDEKVLFREGFVAELKGKLGQLRDGQDVTKAIRQFNGSKAASKQLEIALGKDGGKGLEAEVHVERIMDRLRPAVQGNSTTAQQLIMAGLAGGAGEGANYGLDLGAPGGTIAGVLGGRALLKLGTQKIDQRVSRKVAEILASDDPETIKRLVKVASQSPQYMGALRTLSYKLGGVESGRNAEVGAAGINRVFGGPVGAAAEEEPR